jgi:glutathione synthase/RimK-type ligase-like ATP-grasp enzyme
MNLYSIPKVIVRTLYLFRKTNFRGITFRKCEHVVWLKVWGPGFFFYDEFINFLSLVNALSNHNINFNILLGYGVGRLTHKKVYFNYSRSIDPFDFVSYSQILHFVSRQLEEQGCQVYPKSNEILYWENKGFMTQKFLELNVSIPKTILIEKDTVLEQIDLDYPFLVKEIHSFSSLGLHKINEPDDLRGFIQKHAYFSKNKYLIAQELIDMRRDLRVILVGNEIVHYYWRINPSGEWKPTSTSFGSEVDFGNFPEHWRSFIISEFKKLNLTTGAFDIAWRNDDLTTTPLILEISPSYQPNPAVDLARLGYSYGEYKKKFSFRNSYTHRYIDIVFSITHKQIAYLTSG